MKKRSLVRIISFCAAAALAAGGFLLKSQLKSNRYRLQIQNGYSRSLDSLNSSINNISLTLQKAQYVTTPRQISTMAAQLMSDAETAKSALSLLPAGEEELTILNRFLSQVGNYAMTVSKKLVEGGEVSGDYGDNMTTLSNTAQRVAEVVGNSQISYNNLDYWAGELDRELGSAVSQESLATSLGELEGQLADYPTLIYDGPYSDHILEKEPAMIKNGQKITELQALGIAAEAAEMQKSGLNFVGEDEGKIPTYRFEGEAITVTVSRSGGYPVYMRRSRIVGNSILNNTQAVDKAKRYLEKRGMTNFTETYYFTDEGVCVVNFAYLDGETVCYTDLIKVGVAMDTGEVMLYEASGYLTNHTDRAFKTPSVTAERASEVVSERLTVNSSRLTLIPTDSAGEERCYEFLCTAADGQEILVYINAVDMAEESILILLKSDGGTLTK